MRLPAIVLVLLIFGVATPVEAQRRSALDDEIAQMFYEGLGRQIGAALESAGAAARGMADANKDIQDARRRFWAEYDAGVRNGAAEVEFGRKLLAKDIGLMSLNVSGGTQGSTVQGLNAIFGELDGGVPTPARAEFEEWIKAIRYVLGANGTNMTVVATPAQLRAAVEKTTRGMTSIGNGATGPSSARTASAARGPQPNRRARPRSLRCGLQPRGSGASPGRR